MIEISIPGKKGSRPVPVSFDQLVIIGANGSGKTRFGSYIEERHPGQTHRIAAQKSLTLPTTVQATAIDIARRQFIYGGYTKDFTDDAQYNGWKLGNRWQGNFNTSLLNDYEKLVVLLFSEESEAAIDFKEGRIPKPTTKLDRVKSVWEKVLPHRKLWIRSGQIQTFPTNMPESKYSASEMSDGERVIFYMIGQVVCAPKGSVVIIDEPEMHIHKNLIKTLYDLIERERPDCPIIYLTHDIDFAVSRTHAIKIWVKSFEGNFVWDYEILDDSNSIPEPLYLEILGSRKDVLFIEGDDSSIDYKLYQLIFEDFTVKPLGSGSKVIHTVSSFNNQKPFHHIASFGLIDRDRRTDKEVMHLIVRDIWVLRVAEVENLLLLESIVRSVASHMGKDQHDTFKQVHKNITDFFESQRENQIIIHYKDLLAKDFNSIASFTKRNKEEVLKEIDDRYNIFDKAALFDKVKAEFDDVSMSKDYLAILRLFNLKNALIPHSRICELTGLKNQDDYFNLVLTLLKKRDATSRLITQTIQDNILREI